MAASRPPVGKKYFTPAEANAALPLVRAIVRDITDLHARLLEWHERFHLPRPGHGLSPAHEEELGPVRDEFDRGRERMREYEVELRSLGIDLKDPATGLIDFPCWMDGREVYLCWRLGEPAVDFWHEVDAGFAGRQRLRADVSPV